jgi:glucokinase
MENTLTIVGIDIGGTKCAASVSHDGGRTVYARDSFATAEAGGAMETLANLASMSEDLLEGASPVAVGISCGGPLDVASGLVLSPPNLPSWDRVPVVEFFARRFPGARAFLRNDADACAIAEWKFGAARGYNNVVFLTFGTGMGAGLILGGRPYTGASGLAGEVGHIRVAETGPEGYGKAGSFEGFCSGGGIARLARARVREAWERGETVGFCSSPGDCETLDAETVARSAREGDDLAREIYRTSAFYLGRGLAILIDVLNPECIVIGSVFARAEALFRDEMLNVVREEALADSVRACRIVPSLLGDALGDFAALSVARQGYEEELQKTDANR